MQTKHPILLKILKNDALHYINVQELFTYHRIVFLIIILHIYTKGSCF